MWKDVANFYYGYYRSNRSARGEPRMDVRDITAITLNMIRYHVVHGDIIFFDFLAFK